MEKLEELRAFIMRVRAMLLDHHLHHEAGGSDVVDLSSRVPLTLFDANTILKADTDNTPVALAVAASRILGRAAAGGITALTAAEVSTLLSLTDYVTKALFDANTILAANVDNTPLALAIAASRIVGRGAAGNIAALTGAQIMAILTGQNGATFSMNTQKISNVVDPAANQDAATKKYVDDNFLPTGAARIRMFNSATTTDFLNGVIGRINVDDSTFDTASGLQTGTWAEGVGDAGSNATTIKDANPTTGTGFVASMRYALVSWDAGASSGFITSVDSATQVTITKNKGLDFGVGDTYTILEAHYTVSTSGYYQIMGLISWDWAQMVADKSYAGIITVNGVAIITSVNQSSVAANVLSVSFADIIHLDAGDILAMAGQSYSGTNLCDVIGEATGRLTYAALALLEAD